MEQNENMQLATEQYNRAVRRYELWRRSVVLLAFNMIVEAHRRRMSRKRRMWVSRILQLRPVHGFYNAIFPELRLDGSRFINYFRMTSTQFEDLLQLVGPRVTKHDFIRKAIPAAERLALTVRFLATGDCYTSMQYHYLISQPAISGIISETCNAIRDVLQPTVLKQCDSITWLVVAKDFEKLWHFPHCCGAIDGRHIEIDCPPNSGSQYYNFKGYNSIVLLAVCDAKYCFRCVDIGACGRRGDSAIFNQGAIGRHLSSGAMDLPQPSPLYEGGPILPYFFIGDEDFPLSTSMLRPYSGRGGLTHAQQIFNYRLSRARRMIENTFSIIVSQWRVLRKPIESQVEAARDIVKAIVCLHNWISKDKLSNNMYIDPSLVDREDRQGNFVPGTWRQLDGRVGFFGPYRGFADNTQSSNMAKHVRDEFCRYFDEEGEVPWQAAAVDGNRNYEQ